MPTLSKKRKQRPVLSGLRPVATAADLRAAARRRFLASERLSLEELAAELGISRATAYRWAGNVEQLAGEVIASIVEDTHRRTVREARGRGAERVVDSIARGMRYIAASTPYRAFLERDPQKALRIVASKEAPVQAHTIALNQQLLEEEIERGTLDLPVDAHTMAYALVRIAESFLYADMIAGEKPDLDKAVEIVKLMLR
ncbi:MAG: TetR/AcrR family transcriptional regulator [Deltaproteobacteria bacterium]|nr:MAG: TetR/AcrR family transcriptional regulator [Deltaproteobacteria bacterium]